MYILIDKTTKIIVGSAAKPLSKSDCALKNLDVVKINNSDFSPKLLGSKLEKIEE